MWLYCFLLEEFGKDFYKIVLGIFAGVTYNGSLFYGE